MEITWFQICLWIVLLAGSNGWNNKYGGGKPDTRGQIKKLESHLKDSLHHFQDENESSEIIKELSSILVNLLDDLDTSISYQENMTDAYQELNTQLNETKCSLSERIIDIENELSRLKKNGVSKEVSSSRGVSEEIQRPRLIESNFFLTPSLDYIKARKYCYSTDAKPFVPKTRNEFLFIVDKTTRLHEFGWMPLTDILSENEAEWDDGTAYSAGPVKILFTDSDWIDGNSETQDCVDISPKGHGDWFNCEKNRPMLCLKNIYRTF